MSKLHPKEHGFTSKSLFRSSATLSSLSTTDHARLPDVYAYSTTNRIPAYAQLSTALSLHTLPISTADLVWLLISIRLHTMDGVWKSIYDRSMGHAIGWIQLPLPIRPWIRVSYRPPIYPYREYPYEQYPLALAYAPMLPATHPPNPIAPPLVQAKEIT